METNQLNLLVPCRVVISGSSAFLKFFFVLGSNKSQFTARFFSMSRQQSQRLLSVLNYIREQIKHINILSI